MLERQITVKVFELMHHRESSVIHIFFDRAEKLISINFSKLVSSCVDLHFLVDHLEAAVRLQSLVDTLSCIVVEDGLTGGLIHDKDALLELIEQLLIADTGYLRLNVEVPSQRYEAVYEGDVDENVPDAVR